jgi:valyl-tRNA synthetase
VYIHGLVLDAQGKKMSKSEGNVLDPVDLIDGIALEPLLDKRTTGLRKPETAPKVRKNTKKEFPDGIPGYGADALRFTFAAMATLGRTVNFDSKRCEGYRNFCNKLWNATRFVLMNCEDHDCGVEGDSAVERSAADRWIVSLLQRPRPRSPRALPTTGWTRGRHDLRLRLERVLRLVPGDRQGADPDRHARPAARHAPHADARAGAILRLAHPIIPFVTEELWQAVAPVAGKSGASIAVAPYPEAQAANIDEAAEAQMAHLKALVDACRNLRGEMGVSPAQRLPLFALGDAAFIEQHAGALQALAKLAEVKVFASEAEWADAAQAAPTAVVGDARLALFMSRRGGREGPPGQGSRAPAGRAGQGPGQAGQRRLHRARRRRR